MRRVSTFCGIALALAAWTTVPALAAAGCAPPKAALPLTILKGMVLAPARISHQPVLLLVDTGAETMLLTPEAVMQFHLEPDPRHTTTTHAVGGTIRTQNARLPSLEFGGEEYYDRSVSVGPLARYEVNDPPIVGLIGANDLRDYDVELDFPGRRLTLYRSGACPENVPPWDPPYGTISTIESSRGTLFLPVVVDGHTVNAVLDSGAAGSMLTLKAAVSAGLTPDMLGQEPGSIGHGADRNPIAVHVHRFDTVQIGGQLFRGVPIGVADIALPQGEMLLGMDYLMSERVWLSYGGHQIFLQRRRPPAG